MARAYKRIVSKSIERVAAAAPNLWAAGRGFLTRAGKVSLKSVRLSGLTIEGRNSRFVGVSGPTKETTMPLHGLGHEFGKQAAALVQILSCLATSSIEGTSRFRSPANYFEKACGSEFRFDPVLRSRDCGPSQVRLYRRLEGNMAKVFAGHVQKHGRFAAFTIEAEGPGRTVCRTICGLCRT